MVATMMTSIGLTIDMALVLALIAAVIIFFMTEWVRIDVVAIMIMVVLPMLGLVNGREAFSGFSSNAVISIIAVIIMARSLDRTGVINGVVRPLIKLSGSHRWRVISLLSITIAFISSVMQNIGAAALFLPALRRISRQSDLQLSQLLLPVGFAAILGGTITLVGSSPLIMLNDLTAPFNLPPFGLFSVTPAGVALVITGVCYFVLFGRWILPRDRVDPAIEDDGFVLISQYYNQLGELFELRYPALRISRPSIRELCDRFLLHTVIVYYPKEHLKLCPPARNVAIKPGAVFAVYGPREKVEEAAACYGFEIDPELTHLASDLSSDYSGIVEGVVPPHSSFIGRSLGEIHFRHRHLLAPLALFRRHKVFYCALETQVLEPGDAILMHGRWEHYQAFRRTRDLIFSHSLDHEILHPQKALLAMGCFGLATVLALFTELALSVCLMAGAVGMVVSGVIKIDEAYQGIDWRTVFLLSGLIPLGMATEKTGAAAWLAQSILVVVGTPSEYWFLVIVAGITTVFTLVVSNVGAVVLLVPLVINLAIESGFNPSLAAMTVGIAASNSFLLPTHQVNALYMGPGHYKSSDFLKVGAPLSVIFIVVLTLMIHFLYR